MHRGLSPLLTLKLNLFWASSYFSSTDTSSLRTDELLVFQVFRGRHAACPRMPRRQIAHPLQLDYAGTSGESGEMAAEIDQIERHAADEGFGGGFFFKMMFLINGRCLGDGKLSENRRRRFSP